MYYVVTAWTLNSKAFNPTQLFSKIIILGDSKLALAAYYVFTWLETFKSVIRLDNTIILQLALKDHLEGLKIFEIKNIVLYLTIKIS